MTTDVYWVDWPLSGKIGIMARPRGGEWLEGEMRSLKAKGVDVLVSLLTATEVNELGLRDEESLCVAEGMEWVSIPIEDRGTPSAMQAVSSLTRLTADVGNGRSVVIHCRMGIGRSAMITGTILVAHGAATAEAFASIERARGCPVPDTESQRRWVDSFIRLSGLL